MKIRYLREFIAVAIFSLLLIGGLNQDSFGQGKGKGGGGGRGGEQPRGGPPPQQQRSGPPPERGGGQPQMRPQPQVRQQPQMRQPQFRPQPQQQQRVFRQPQMRPQPQPQQQRVFKQPQMRPQPQQQRVFRQPQMRPEPQRQVFRQSPGQMRREERRALRQPQQIPRQQAEQVARGGQTRKIERQQQQRQNNVLSPVLRDQERGRGNIRSGQRGVLTAPPFQSGWIPPGQIRSAEVHERNAIRQANRQAQQAYQQPYYGAYAPVYDYGYVAPNYSEVYYPSYQYYVTQYVNPYDYAGYGGYLAYSPLYVPNTYLYAPYSAYASYPYYDYYSVPYSSAYDYGFDWKSMLVRTLIGFALGSSDDDYYGGSPYDPYYGYTQTLYSDESYAPYGGYYPSYQEIDYVQPVYSYAGYDVPLVDVIPMYDMYGPSYGGYSSVTYREVLAQGYEQGYQAGWYARENELRNDFIDSGYVLDAGYIDPYSYTIGENRRCFSEGYSIGYQDALAGRQEYFDRYSGNTDLVSLLLSNVIGVV
jgi:hypothetical protein